jgi:ATP-dependent DNA helicase RecQ
MMEKIAMDSVQEILQAKFGYSSFRFDQREIIDNVLAGKDTFVLMPTGGGKSLCYQIPALVLEGLTIVVSPLISLMKDQVDALKLNGIEAACLNSSVSIGEQQEIIGKIRERKLKLLYLAPERFFGKESQFIEFLKSVKVSLFAIDEAHCISSWGHDFRPEYLMLSKLRQEFKEVPVIALTATADDLTRKDILEKLALDNPHTFVSSFNRANIHYYVEPKKNSYERLISYIRARREDSGIIYVLSRKSVEELSANLRLEGFSVRPYHAGLDKKVKEENQDLFIKDKVKIIVATIAFGMGIDKSNVRYVIHMDLPKNIEGYYQETGRAGRDGLLSDALLFYSSGDLIKLKRFAEVEGNSSQSAIMMNKLNKMAEFCELRTCRRKYLLNYFGEEFPDKCGTCDVCLSNFEKEDGTIVAQKALSAVYRLNERFGINYVVDFLRGSKSEKINYQHMDLKTYGAGADISKNDWVSYIKELIAAGYLKQEGDPYPVLKLTEKSHPVLRGEQKVELVKITSRSEVEESAPEYEEDLLSELKGLRTSFAEKENVPAYIIFSDATLMELSVYLPQDISELKLISGFGEMKTEKYGEYFLEVIKSYCTKNNLPSRIEKKSPKKIRKISTGGARLKDTKLESFNLFRLGKSISEISELRKLSVITIETHLTHYISEGELEVTELVSKEKIPAIENAIKIHGSVKLTPLKEELGNNYSFGEIKAVVSYINRRRWKDVLGNSH